MEFDFKFTEEMEKQTWKVFECSHDIRKQIDGAEHVQRDVKQGRSNYS